MKFALRQRSLSVIIKSTSEPRIIPTNNVELADGICFGIVSYVHFYRGRTELGGIIAVLTVSQLTLAVLNCCIAKNISETNEDDSL